MDQNPPTSPVDVEQVQEEQESAPSASPSPVGVLGSWLREIGETVLPAIVIAVLINLFLAQATRVYGSSMEPTLSTDQRLVVEKVSYHFHSPRRGDVVVVRMPERGPELLIKRIVALPGETIEVRDGHVYVDGVALAEPYLTQRTNGSHGPVTVPPGHVFVMGDNRGASNDSRVFGPVSLDRVVGRAWVSYWPLESVGVVD